MICKFITVFVLLFICQACLSARVTRNIFEESEEQKENFMAQLNDTQKAEYKKIVDDIKAAKTLAEKAFEAKTVMRFAISGSLNAKTTDDDSSEETMEKFEQEFDAVFDADGKAQFSKLIANLESAKTDEESSAAVSELTSYTMAAAISYAARMAELGSVKPKTT